VGNRPADPAKSPYRKVPTSRSAPMLKVPVSNAHQKKKTLKASHGTAKESFSIWVLGGGAEIDIKRRKKVKIQMSNKRSNTTKITNSEQMR